MDYFNVKTHDINVTKMREILNEYICSIKFQDMREGVTLRCLGCMENENTGGMMCHEFVTLVGMTCIAKLGATKTTGIVQCTFMITNNIT